MARRVTSSVSGNGIDRSCFRIVMMRCGKCSAHVRWGPLLSAVVVNHLVTRPQVASLVSAASHQGGSQEGNDAFALVTGKAAFWRGDSVVAGVVRVIDAQPSYLTLSSVPGNYVQVDVPVLVLQEGVVEVVGLRCLPQCGGSPPKLMSEISPFCSRELVDGLDMTAYDQRALAGEVLVAVKHQPPEHAICQYGVQLVRTKNALHRYLVSLARVISTSKLGGEPPLRRSFQATGQLAHGQIRGRSRCPWVTSAHRSFPPVPARVWHRPGVAAASRRWREWSAARDGRGALGLVYMAAAWPDRLNAPVDTNPFLGTMLCMPASGFLLLYHGTSGSRIEHICETGLFSLEPPNNAPAYWTLTDSKDDAWSHARKWAERDHAQEAVITYRVPEDEINQYLYVSDGPLTPDVPFVWYALRKPLPGHMTVTIDWRGRSRGNF
jgi:hypothetical protein